MGLARCSVAEVFCPGSRLVGSGYFCTPRLVLTAGHIVSTDLSSEVAPEISSVAQAEGLVGRLIENHTVCRVRSLDTDVFVDAVPVWWSSTADVALLAITRPHKRGVVPPVTWGDVPGSDPVGVTAVGFPEADVNKEGVRDSRQVSGTLNPLSGVKTGLYKFHVSGNVGPTSSGVSSWSGMSGASLFAENILIGVVLFDPAPGDSGRLELWARPAKTFADDPSFLFWIRWGGGEGSWKRSKQASLSEKDLLPGDVKRKHIPASIMQLGKYALLGRDSELQALTRLSNDRDTKIIVVHGVGGVGKTSLIGKWILDADYSIVFAWEFRTQLGGEASSEDFFVKALQFFQSPRTTFNNSPDERGGHLGLLVTEKRSLLVLDGLDVLQQSPQSPYEAGRLKDPSMRNLLHIIAQAGSETVCVITTRHRIPDIEDYESTQVKYLGKPNLPDSMHCQLGGLTIKNGVELLRTFNIEGSRLECESLVGHVKGHALTLKLLAGYLREAHERDVRRWDRINFQEADTLVQGGHATHILNTYVTWLSSGGENGFACLSILYLLSLFDGAVERDALSIFLDKPIWGLSDGLFALNPEAKKLRLSQIFSTTTPISEDALNIAFTTLANCGLLLTVSEERQLHWVERTVDTYPLVREYFRSRAKRRKSAWKEAHSKLYSVSLTKCETELPDSPNDLKPLYKAISHGCQAGRHLEVLDSVYIKRILRHDKMYSTRRLGAFTSDIAAISCFFETRWKRILPGFSYEQQAWLLAKTGFYLYVLGRVREAGILQKKACELNVQIKRWADASVNSSELCTTEACIGNLVDAENSAKRAVTYARKTGIYKKVIGRITALGQTLHQAGRERDARKAFEEAAELQSKMDKQHSRLYGLWGYRYAEFLIADAEHAVWHRTVTGHLGFLKKDMDRFVVDCRHAGDSTISGAVYLSLLSLGLERLTRAKTIFFQMVLEESLKKDNPMEIKLRDLFLEAICLLHQSATREYICRGLLMHAWFLRSINDVRTAVQTLDEAYDLAYWSPLTLCLADTYLMRAGLFYNQISYPWKAPMDDVKDAKIIIERSGYGLRKKRLGTIEWALNEKGKKGIGR